MEILAGGAKDDQSAAFGDAIRGFKSSVAIVSSVDVAPAEFRHVQFLLRNLFGPSDGVGDIDRDIAEDRNETQ